MRVIAYYMHEEEAAEALSVLSNTSVTSSFVIGDIDVRDWGRLEEAGLTVDPLNPDARLETASAARAGFALRGSEAEARDTAPPGEVLPLEPGVPAQWVLRLGGPMVEEQRAAVLGTGATLQRAVPTYAYVLTATPEQAEEVLNLPFVGSVERYGPHLAAPVRLPAGEVGRAEGEEETVEVDTGTRTWDVVLTDAEARPAVAAWIRERAGEGGAEILAESGRRMRIRLPAGSPLEGEIKQVPGVVEMTQYVPPRLYNDAARVLLGVTSSGNPGGDLPFTGRGQVVAVADTGLDDTHPDFAGRVLGTVALGRPGDSSDPHGHGTHVSGSILGDGSASQGTFRGIAPEANLYFQSIMDSVGRLGGLPLSLEDLFEPAYQAGARIHNNSWGAPTQAAYTADSDEVDAFMRRRPDMLVVIAAGNDGTAAAVRLRSEQGFVDWLSVGSPATSKNALTVGAARTDRTDGPAAATTWGEWHDVHDGFPFPDDPIAREKVSGDAEGLAAFSSRGPCDDWRIKPDVVAPGTDILSARAATAPERSFWGLHPNDRYAFMGGTSMAAPLVAGCAALVREYYVRERTADPSAALIKATLINGTRTLSGQDAMAEDPHYHQGFGVIHLPSTLPNAHSPDLVLDFIDTWDTPARQLRENGDRIRLSVEAAAGTPLRFCLAYTDLPSRSLQNDLSLLLEAPDGTKLTGNGDLPNRLLRTDSTNNVEVIRIPSPQTGRYLIQIYARSLLQGPQDYALVVTGKLTSPLKRVIG
ncbi:S8 family serine peptidase [Streptomyces sp. NPDC046876]|uniref:S8 family serine peptidase n=1 Tax=Streptomyces sp. NPDC046876 TaxID=3155616 RepID=UPI0034104509